MACELIQREFTTSEGKELLIGVRQLAASKALDLHVELVSMFGSFVFPFIENKYNFADIIYLMQKSSSDVKYSDFVRRVVCMGTLDGQEISPKTFDYHFGRDLMLVHKIFAFVVEANFLDFFKEGLELNEQRRLEAAEASKLEEQKNSSPKI